MSPVTCGSCDAAFTRQSDCDRHQNVHLPDSLLCCQQCCFLSTRKDSLKRHVDRYHKEIGDHYLPMETNENYQPLHDDIQPTALSNQINSMYHEGEFDKRLQLPHNFIYAGASQSVS